MKTRNVITAAVVLVVLASLPAMAATTIGLGSVNAQQGGTVVVPISIDLDPAGRLSRAAGNPVQAMSFKIVYDPAMIKAIKIRRAGVTASLSPLFEASPRTSDSVAYLASFDANESPLLLAESADAPSDVVAEVEVTLAETARGNIALTLDPNTTTLSNQAGTVTLSVKDGSLVLRNGVVDMAGRERGARPIK